MSVIDLVCSLAYLGIGVDGVLYHVDQRNRSFSSRHGLFFVCMAISSKMVDEFICSLNVVFDAQSCLCQVLSRPPACFLKPVPSIFPNSSDGAGLLSFKRKDLVWVCDLSASRDIFSGFEFQLLAICP